MSDQESTGDIKKEAADHLQLGTLLNRDRDGNMRAQVAAILEKDMPVADKIRDIRRLDTQAAAGAVAGPQAGPEQDPETVAQPLNLSLHTIKSVIKVPHPRAAYLEYLFRHHSKIKTFDRRHHVLTFAGLFPRVRLSPDTAKGYREQLQPLAAEMIRLCDRAMETGWLTLNKFDYNLIVLLRRLCFEISAVNFAVLNYKDRNLVDSLRNLETYFLVMHYRPEFGHQVTKALITALATEKKITKEPEEITVGVARLLSDDLMMPSLYGLMVGLNIVKLRRMLTLDDFLCRDLGQIINDKDYACLPATKKEIQEQVQNLKKQLVALRKQKTEVDHIKEVLQRTPDGDPDFSPIQSVYDRATTRGESQHFRSDQDNLMLFVPRFLKAFDDTFFPLLSGRVQLANLGKVSIFGDDFFPMQFHKLRQVTAELARLNFQLHVFTRARFIMIKNTGKGAVAAESRVLQQLDQAVHLILEIAGRAEEILKSPLREPDILLKDAPRRPIVVPDRKFALPHMDQRIQARNSLQDKPVAECLKYLVAVAYAIGAFLMDRPILLTLERGEKIDAKIHKSLSELQRIGEPDMFKGDARLAELALAVSE